MQKKVNRIFCKSFLTCLLFSLGILNVLTLKGQQEEFPIYYRVNEGEEKLKSLTEVLAWKEKVWKLEIVNDTARILPHEIYSLGDLEELTLFACGYQSLPEGISALKKLKILQLYYTRLVTFPSDFSGLKNLQELMINKFDCHGVRSCAFELPPDFENLFSLKKLDLVDLNWVEIPDEICGLPNLTQLRLLYFKAKTFPYCLFGVKTLKSLRW